MIAIFLVIFAIGFIFRKSGQGNKIIAYISKILYMLVIPFQIGYKIDRKIRPDYLLYSLVFLAFLYVFAKILVNLFNINKSKKDFLTIPLAFPSVFLTEDILVRLVDAELVRAFLLLTLSFYLIHQLIKKYHRPEDFIISLAIIFITIFLKKIDIYFESMEIFAYLIKIISGLTYTILLGLGLIFFNSKFIDSLIDVRIILLALIRVFLFPLFIYILITAFTNDMKLVNGLVIMAIMPTSALVILDNPKGIEGLGLFVWSYLLSLLSIPLITRLLL